VSECDQAKINSLDTYCGQVEEIRTTRLYIENYEEMNSKAEIVYKLVTPQLGRLDYIVQLALRGGEILFVNKHNWCCRLSPVLFTVFVTAAEHHFSFPI
jgi:hypothetical protein